MHREKGGGGSANTPTGGLATQARCTADIHRRKRRRQRQHANQAALPTMSAGTLPGSAARVQQRPVAPSATLTSPAPHPRDVRRRAARQEAQARRRRGRDARRRRAACQEAVAREESEAV
eukprot:355736-Chlamydomonas_euryale.AAC.8